MGERNSHVMDHHPPDPERLAKIRAHLDPRRRIEPSCPDPSCELPQAEYLAGERAASAIAVHGRRPCLRTERDRPDGLSIDQARRLPELGKPGRESSWYARPRFRG